MASFGSKLPFIKASGVINPKILRIIPHYSVHSVRSLQARLCCLHKIAADNVSSQKSIFMVFTLLVEIDCHLQPCIFFSLIIFIPCGLYKNVAVVTLTLSANRPKMTDILNNYHPLHM